ncbi:MAG: hypothetical protein OEW49_05410 [Nitrosopumilus sp.]|nr:hypothetical protein [Nitrosopumilus sp.]
MKTKFLTIILFVVSITLPLTSYAETEHYSFVSQLGKPAPIEGTFESPTDLAVDSKGNVYVTGAASIQKFSSDGKFIAKLNDSHTRPFIEPRAIAIDSKDNVYVIDSYNSRILKYVNDKQMTVFANHSIDSDLFSYPIKIALDSKDNVHVADHALKEILKFSSDGNLLTKWGTKGSKEGQFENISGIAIDSKDNVYVADQGHIRNDEGGQTSQPFSRIQKFTNNGQLMEKLDFIGIDDGLVPNTISIDVDSNGNIYAADFNNDRIQKFTNDGKFVSKWGNANTIHYPKGISIDSYDDIYVIHEGGVTKFSRDGNMITHFEASDGNDVEFTASSGITIDHDGNIYVSDGNMYAIGKGVLKFAKANTQSDIQTIPLSEKVNGHNDIELENGIYTKSKMSTQLLELGREVDIMFVIKDSMVGEATKAVIRYQILETQDEPFDTNDIREFRFDSLGPNKISFPFSPQELGAFFLAQDLDYSNYDGISSAGSVSGRQFHVVEKFNKNTNEDGLCMKSGMVSLFKPDFSTNVCVTPETVMKLMSRWY